MLAPNPSMLPATMPEQVAPKFHDVTICIKKKYQCARVMGVPPEEFGIASTARTVADSGYCHHSTARKQSDLIDEGYDEEAINRLPSYRPHSLTPEEQARDTVQESYQIGDSGSNKANRQLLITEHYIKLDYEGDGKAAIYRITTGEDYKPLAREDEDDVTRVDFYPFAAMTPVIMTHRFWGRSIADLVMDIQRIKTVLVRGLLDNQYQRNNFRTEIADSHTNANTIDDILITRPGGIVRTKMPGGLTPLTVEDISPAIYPALQYFDATREWRTGVSRQGQGVDPNALQNQVATIANQMEQMSDKKLKLIARIFAETGIRDLFSLLHATIRKHGSQAQTVRLRNRWVEVDPREWKQRDDMTIQVGLGTGNKAQQLAGIQMIIGAQQQAVAAGLVSKDGLWHTAQALTRVLGFPDAGHFFVDPGKPPDPQNPNAAALPPPPDPKHAEIAAKAQAEQAKIQADAAHQQMKTQADIHFQQMKAEIDTQLARNKAQSEAQLAQQKFELDRQLAMLKAQIDERKALHDMHMHEQDQAAKQQERNQPKASIEVKHGAAELSGPLGEAIGQFGQHMQANGEALGQFGQHMQAMHQAHADMMNKHQEMTQAMLKQANAPKRVIRGKDGKVSHVETVTH